MNILPHTSHGRPASGALNPRQAPDQAATSGVNSKARPTLWEATLPAADGFESLDPELQVASYGKIVGEFVLFLGTLPLVAAGAAAALGGTVAVAAGMLAGPVLFAAGLFDGSVSTAAMGLGIGAASYLVNKGMGKLMDRIDKATEKKARRPSLKPSLPAPSQIPGAGLTRDAVLALASKEGAQAYQKLASHHDHGAPIFGGYVRTHAQDYEAPTLGQMHARAGREIRSEQVQAVDRLRRAQVSLALGAVLAGAAAVSGVGVAGVGLGGLSGLMLKSAHDAYEDHKGDLALADAHASNQQLMERLGRLA